MFRTRLRVAGLDVDFTARGPFEIDRFRHRFGPYERDATRAGGEPAASARGGATYAGSEPVPAADGDERAPTANVGESAPGANGGDPPLSLRLWVEPLGKQLGPADVPYPGVKAYPSPAGVKLLREGLSMWLGFDGRAEAFARGPQRLPRPPFEEDAGPADTPLRLLASHALLARGAGALVHACGVLYRGRGILIVGPSGAGKTTCARLARPESVLSDDQVALLETPAGLALESTPFVGLFGRTIAPTRAPLGGLVVLDRARPERLEPLGGAAALGSLLRCLPLYTRTAATAGAALRLAERVVREAPLVRGAPGLGAPLEAWLGGLGG
ncbi:MAG TPA: hypothetical protein VFS43_03260 [Polyangiaceae bacterium]|nr:hypothetical protein [Polyangiaceae bacterium]